jgi:hypothetical protein
MKRAAILAWCAVLVAGCSGSSVPPTGPRSEDVARVEDAFRALQAAIKERDGNKIWTLLDQESRVAAEDRARSLRENFAKIREEPAGAEMARSLELTPEELAKLTGPGFLKSKLFFEKYSELPTSTIAKPTAIEGDQATVFYQEADGDNESIRFIRHEGQWRVSAPMPVLPRP